ncbi:IS5 family transposase domain protein [Rickettsiales endosymbiont of Paramecium tredecaurelia]|nr:IS5 family transposase domain protein [Candidatus Sarmatiella mevalonica]
MDFIIARERVANKNVIDMIKRFKIVADKYLLFTIWNYKNDSL